MRLRVLTLAPALALLASRAAAQCICARYIRPYSDNAYVWGSTPYCAFTADPNALIADDIEFYDPQYGCDTPLYTMTCCERSNSCAEYIDCDGPETPLPAPSVYLADGWAVDVPCAVDTPGRILAGAVATYAPSTTPYACTAACGARGYRYAGVEYGDECYCGTGYVGEVVAANYSSDCQMRCAGSYRYTCGGSWRMQTYKLD